jgi:precorrin-4 methylase
MLRPALVVLLAVAIVAVSLLSSCAEEITTYAEWCERLNELHKDMQTVRRNSAARFWSGLVLTIVGSITCELAILGDAEISIVLGSVVAVLAGSVLVVQSSLSLNPIGSEIAALEEAGRYRMWFYPCDEVGSD